MQVLVLISHGVSYHVYQIQLCIIYTAFGGEPIALPSAGRRFVGSSASTSIVLRPEETWFTPAALHAQTNYHIHSRRGTTPTLEILETYQPPRGRADFSKSYTLNQVLIEIAEVGSFEGFKMYLCYLILYESRRAREDEIKDGHPARRPQRRPVFGKRNWLSLIIWLSKGYSCEGPATPASTVRMP